MLLQFFTFSLLLKVHISLACYYWGMLQFDYEITSYTERRTVTSAEIIINNSEEKVEVTVSKQYLPQLCCKMVDSNSNFVMVSFDNCDIVDVEGCLSASIANVARSFKITNNRLRSVKKGTFANLKVNTISLSNNLIETLENDAFYNLTNLITLSLSRNHLEVLNPEAFFLLPNLAALDLMFNRIHTLQTGFFKFLTNNVQVLLNCNRISRVEKAFAGVFPRTRLTIDLNGNRIQTLSEDVFSNHTFGQLDLGNNPVKKIAKTFCEGCTMETLYLSCDYLTLEDVEMIRNWTEVALVRLFTSGCSYHNMTIGGVSPSQCNQAKNNVTCNFLLYLGLLFMVNCI
ncbi:hypothetical protein Zmor_022216 [Zophobas morio]|uniref:Uncharacterized protein n=1 Tax=Zophobas morio TaxID=2755281 RepID=A0AA38HW08_9CUCU|nr:hypothetical protein Zmor_022216 [Zophobas morio]